MRKQNNIALMIYPTPYQDYDIVAVGNKEILRRHQKLDVGTHLISNSKFGGISILVIDTVDNLKDALNIIKQFRAGNETIPINTQKKEI